MDSAAARELTDRYRRSATEIAHTGTALASLVSRAAELLGEADRLSSSLLEGLSIELAYEADDVAWRLDFLEATDGFVLPSSTRAGQGIEGDQTQRPPDSFSYEEKAALFSAADNQRELEQLVGWLFDSGGVYWWNSIVRDDPIPLGYRPLFAGAIIMAHEGGWRPANSFVPSWLTAGLVRYGELSEELLVSFARHALDDRVSLRGLASEPNPFALDEDRGAFAPFADALSANPAAGRAFLSTLFDDLEHAGDTRLNMHEDGSGRADQLAQIIVSAGTQGTLTERQTFVDELVTAINADNDTNMPVFTAAWAVHAELVLEHGIETTSPTFDTHHTMPDFFRPTWEHTWNDRISPATLGFVFDSTEDFSDAAALLTRAGKGPAWNAYDWFTRSDTADLGPGNDPGGTYTTRPKLDFPGTRMHFSEADRGRNIITHALHDASAEGDVAQDEFAIVNHGIGPNGRPTYTINLPGVIDLSSPHRGWDETHRSVRDMDMAAMASAPTARVEDNLYAQMVKRALQANSIPLGSNLLLVGHSFGADTVADLAAESGFTEDYNVTHVVAAAYDSAPQLAHISPDIQVLVLQNNQDRAVGLEAFQRVMSAAPASTSVNTFAHDVRRFDGGGLTDIGHHQSRYITYLTEADDPELTTFLESVAATGYGDLGTSFAVDVSLDDTLLP